MKRELTEEEIKLIANTPYDQLTEEEKGVKIHNIGRDKIENENIEFVFIVDDDKCNLI